MSTGASEPCDSHKAGIPNPTHCPDPVTTERISPVLGGYRHGFCSKDADMATATVQVQGSHAHVCSSKASPWSTNPHLLLHQQGVLLGTRGESKAEFLLQAQAPWAGSLALTSKRQSPVYVERKPARKQERVCVCTGTEPSSFPISDRAMFQEVPTAKAEICDQVCQV